ncbi:hypothetical protein KSC_002820 [Ktedonobacter sp. SOSP1-52]|uniref:hypothetical protein n=1 Tax=Ktedonobacter sp. SOSP1-52 TaxID=2778366 RepID=UPI001916197D|nr:hypothetical protein [Ktedonobacter sp. SOSP1-52]GHO61390.1 hypothetical protein KSC_002820 [Ktedonobacter sp. SOSP1-52]
MQLSIITDEISQDMPRALRVCRDLQVKMVELRTIDGESVFWKWAKDLYVIT